MLGENESALVFMFRPTLYGPGINASSVETLREHYEAVFHTLARVFGLGNINITTADHSILSGTQGIVPSGEVSC